MHSLSSAPLVVALSDGYGHPMRYWTTLRKGQELSQSLLTGRQYGYCFSQPAGAGFASTRGCGALVVHEYMNGIRLPDGAVTASSIAFSR